MKRPVDFLIIGAQKAGTTSLWTWLRNNPRVFLPRAKEIHYWTQDEFWKQGPAYLEPFFDELADEDAIGASYVHLLFHENAPERVASYNADMKVIACVRDPVARAYSAYWFAKLNGWEPAPTFEQALELEQDRRSGSYQERSELTYLSHGYYAQQLGRWRQVLGPDQVKVVVSDELRHRAHETLGQVTDWLGVPAGPPPPEGQVVNGAAAARFPMLQKALMRESSLKAGFRKMTTPRLRWQIQQHVVEPLAWWNRRYQSYPPIEPSTRARLVQHFEPHICDLEALLGRDLDAWRESSLSAS